MLEMTNFSSNLRAPLKELRNLHPLWKRKSVSVMYEIIITVYICNIELTGPAGAADQKSRTSSSKCHLPGLSVSFGKRSQLHALRVFRTNTNKT